MRDNDRVPTLAGALLPNELRSLGAVHLATAGRLGSDLGEIVTYDEHMSVAARAIGTRSLLRPEKVVGRAERLGGRELIFDAVVDVRLEHLASHRLVRGIELGRHFGARR